MVKLDGKVHGVGGNRSGSLGHPKPPLIGLGIGLACQKEPRFRAYSSQDFCLCLPLSSPNDLRGKLRHFARRGLSNEEWQLGEQFALEIEVETVFAVFP